jgi:hypothetical protein
VHALFDDGSLYNQFRAGFDPAEKLQGYFRWLALKSQAHTILAQGDSPQPASEPPLQMAAEPAVPRELLRSAPVFLADEPGRYRLATVEVVLNRRKGETGSIRLLVRLAEPAGLAGRLPARFRAFLLDPEVIDRLRRAVGGSAGEPVPDTLQKVFLDETVAGNAEAALILSAVPEMEGVISVRGGGATDKEVDLPVYAELPSHTTVALVLGPRVG